MKKVFFIILILMLSGCASLQVKTPSAVVLQEDRIYTLPAGQSVQVEVDHVPQMLTFPTPMKITTSDHLIKEEKKLNDAVLDKAKADKGRNKWIGLLGSLLAVAAGGVGVVLKYGKGDKKS